MQTVDLLYASNTNKQFITVQSRDGQTYYLIIDYDKPIDEENEIYETYFLNLVDERDLLSLLSEEDMPTPTPTPSPTPVPTTSAHSGSRADAAGKGYRHGVAGAGRPVPAGGGRCAVVPEVPQRRRSRPACLHGI